MSKIVNRAKAVKVKHENGLDEIYINVGGKWLLVAWEPESSALLSASRMQGKYFVPNRRIADSMMVPFSTESLTYLYGISRKELLAKQFIFEWTTEQEVYGVPF